MEKVKSEASIKEDLQLAVAHVSDTLAEYPVITVIENDEQAEQATKQLQIIALLKKDTAGRRDLIIKPLKDHVKYLEGEFRKVEQPVLDAEMHIRSALSAYAREKEELARKEEARLRALHEKKVEKAEAKGKVYTAPAPTVERAPVAFASSTGTTAMRKVKKIRVTDMTAVLQNPKVKKLLIEQAQATGLLDKVIKKLVDAGTEIKGIELYDDFIPVTRV